MSDESTRGRKAIIAGSEIPWNKLTAGSLPPAPPPPILDGDTYQEGDAIVFTAQFHLRRGYCCGSGCRHCPYK